MTENKEILKQFKKGTLEIVILSIVNVAPSYGYEIVQNLVSGSKLFYDIKEGTVYPVLYRLEDDKYISSEMTVVCGRKKKTYFITQLGREYLKELIDIWEEFKKEVDLFIGAENEKK